MKLVLREYLSTLKERSELDSLLGDLLASMGFQVLSRPQRGVRQYGVDIAAVGNDPERRSKKTLFLFLVKAGDLDRVAWDGNVQAIRPSLNEILDVYLQSHVASEHRNLPKKIIVCSGGDLTQEVQQTWAQYTRSHARRGRDFDYWGADKLAILLEVYLFDERLFPESMRKHLRKALVLLDLPEYDLSHVAALFEGVLFAAGLARERARTPDLRRELVRRLRVTKLSLDILFRWSRDANNLRPAVLAGELSILRAWDLLRRRGFQKDRGVLLEFIGLLNFYRVIALAYVDKLVPYCAVRDGLFGYGPAEAETVEYPLRVFELVGILGTIGLDYYECSVDGRDGPAEVARRIGNLLVLLLRNNPGARSPVFDGHVIEVHLAMLLLTTVGRCTEGGDWLVELAGRVALGFRTDQRFPIDTDSYEELIALQRGESKKDEFVKGSWLLPAMAEWAVILERTDLYEAVVNTASALGGPDLQLWYPDEETDGRLYGSYAAGESGSTEAPIILSETLADFRDRMLRVRRQGLEPDKISAIAAGFPQIVLMACRHFRTPIMPFFWQRLCRAPDPLAPHEQTAFMSSEASEGQ